MSRDTDHDYWQAVAAQVGEHCDFYSPEDLAAFVEGRVRGRNARALEAHLHDCGSCRQLVQELRRELAPEPVAVRVRFARPRAWAWGVAGTAVAAALVALILLRPVTPVGPTPPGPQHPPAAIAQVPPSAATHPQAPRATDAVRRWPRPQAGTTRPTVSRAPHPRPAQQGRGGRTPEQPPAAGESLLNLLPDTASLAFNEVLPTVSTGLSVEELLREGAVNDLPEAAPPEPAEVAEFYEGLAQLEEELGDQPGGGQR